MNRPLHFLVQLGIALLASQALAADGVLEINQTCAIETGCFSGDTPGFPVSIDGSAGHSYHLTSPLVPTSSSVGISVSADAIGIDLGGFAIVSELCTQIIIDCTPSAGLAAGINGFGRSGLSVQNGAIMGMSFSGIRVGDYALIKNVSARWNRTTGIQVGNGSILEDIVVTANSGVGVLAGLDSVVRGVSAKDNGSNGISVAGGSVVMDISSSQNDGIGINCTGSCVITRNATTHNDGDGIRSQGASQISLNTVANNQADGIDAAAHSLVKRNNVYGNDSIGLRLGAGAAYSENSITDNGSTVSGGLNGFSNLCDGNFICP